MILKESFNLWNKIKQKINFGVKEKFYVNRREIWYVNLGVNIGTEIHGKSSDFRRPMLILKKIGSLYLCVAMTTHGKDNNYFYFKYKDNSYIILSQVRSIDRKRFLNKIGIIDEKSFNKIIKKLKIMWF